MARRVFGLDFGTTNSLASYVDAEANRVIDLVNLDDERPHPSVVWYRGGGTVVGRNARTNLDTGEEAISGDFVRSPKRLLAGDAPVFVAGREIDPSDIVAEVLQFLRSDATSPARERGAVDIERAVMTIPIGLDGAGRRRLRRAARKAGISVVQFVHEPLAALYGYLRSQADYRRRVADLDGQRLLVFDWGGGTLDLTLCVLANGRLVQIANRGDNTVGGDWFDEAIRNLVREKHAKEHGLEGVLALEAEGAAVRLLNACERAKIALSEVESYPIQVVGYLREGPGADLRVRLDRDEVERIVQPIVQKGMAQIESLLSDAQLSPQDIGLCLPTGGMVQMPIVRAGLLQKFGARTERLSNGDRIIAQGAAWIAHDGLQLKLAKPIELLQPDGSYATVVEESLDLPVEDSSVTIDQRMYYCVDPRDGLAHFQFARPRRIGYGANKSDRLVYTTVSLKVDPNARPLKERLEAEITIDADYVVAIQLRSLGRLDERRVEIFDLEFALALPTPVPEPKSIARGANADSGSAVSGGAVRLRSNVTAHYDAWSQIPGDILTRFEPAAFSRPWVTELQKDERYYYQPCATCRRTAFECEREGCDHPICATQGMISRAAAEKRRLDLPTSRHTRRFTSSGRSRSERPEK